MFAIAVLMIYIYVAFGSKLGDIWIKILCLISIVGILYIFVRIIINRFDECFTIRKDEVAVEHGILNKTSTEVSIRKIRSIQVQQRIIQRIFNVGDIYIASAGTESYEIVAHGIRSPHDIRDLLQSIVRTTPVKTDDMKADD
jgi:uncharacterized membrane protein YdbT with pleckstrin-like domain